MSTTNIAPATASSIRLVDRYFPRNRAWERANITTEPSARHNPETCRFRDGEDSQNGRRAAAAAVHRCEESEMLARSVTLDQVEYCYDGEMLPDSEWDQFGAKAVLDAGEPVMLAWGTLLDELEDRYYEDGDLERRDPLADSRPVRDVDADDPLAGLKLVRYVDAEFGAQMVRIEEDWDSDGTPVTYRVMEMRTCR